MITKTTEFGTWRRQFATRQANPETDVDLDGNPLDGYVVVFVRVKDCPIVRQEKNITYIDTENAPQAIKLDYGSSYYGYSEWKQVKLKQPEYIQDNISREYSARTSLFYRRIKYSVHNGRVYTKSIKTLKMPESFKRQNKRTVLTEFIRKRKH